MKIKRSLSLLFLFFTLSVYSQNWQSLNGGSNYSMYSIYGDTINNILYATGGFTEISGIAANYIARWNGSTWDSIGSGLLNVLSNKHAFTMYNGELVSANNMFSYYHPHIARWDGTQWDSIGSNFVCDFSGTFFGVATLNNELYAYGAFDSINHTYYNSIAKWDGQNWVSVGFPYRFTGDTPYILCLELYNNELYAAGAFSDSSYQMVNIAKYDGSTWSIVGGGFHGPMDQVYDLEVYQNELYAAGEFKTSDGNANNYIARWNGTEWNNVGGDVTSPDNSQINDLLVLNNKLYAGGVFTEIGGVPATHIAAWDGTNWCGFGNTDSASIGCLATINNDLYITCGERFDGITVNRIAKWVGGNYIDTCGNTTGIEQLNITNEAFIVYPNPTQSQLTIEFELTLTKNVSIEIKNVLGQTVKTIDSRVLSIGNNKIEIDVREFSKGLYFMQFAIENKIMSKTFVKQ